MIVSHIKTKKILRKHEKAKTNVREKFALMATFNQKFSLVVAENGHVGERQKNNLTGSN